MSITRWSNQHQESRYRHQLLGVNSRSLYSSACGRPYETQFSPPLHEHSHWILSSVGVLGQIAHQQFHAHLIRVYLRSTRYLHSQPLQYLGDDERCPHLLLYHHSFSRPQL